MALFCRLEAIQANHPQLHCHHGAKNLGLTAVQTPTPATEYRHHTRFNTRRRVLRFNFQGIGKRTKRTDLGDWRIRNLCFGDRLLRSHGCDTHPGQHRRSGLCLLSNNRLEPVGSRSQDPIPGRRTAVSPAIYTVVLTTRR